jgi:hypothetical protein
MPYKKFRNAMFVVGDLVSPRWKTMKPYGLGIIYKIEQEGHYNRVCVCWQLVGSTIEHATDIEVVQQIA